MLRILKTLVGFTAFVHLIVALAATAGLFYYFTTQSAAAQVTHLSSVKGFLLCASILILMLFVTGLTGLRGCVKDSRNLLSFYMFMALLWIGIALLISITSIVIQNQLSKQGCQSPNFPSIKNLNIVVLIGGNTLCRASCTCYLKTSPSKSTSTSIFLSSTNNQSLPVNAQSCPSYFGNSSLTQYMTLMQYYLSCSGWCTPTQYYLFSDINLGVPQIGCFDALLTNLQYYNRFLRYGVGVAILWMYMSGVLTYWILKAIEQRHQNTTLSRVFKINQNIYQISKIRRQALTREQDLHHQSNQRNQQALEANNSQKQQKCLERPNQQNCQPQTNLSNMPEQNQQLVQTERKLS